MKPKASWSFSCPINEVDINRIMKEARYKVVRFTIDGKVYTAWPDDRVSYNPPIHTRLEGESVPGYLCPKTFVERHEDGQIKVWFDSDPRRVRIEPGDHVKAIVDCVTVKVEVFEVPL